MTRHTNPTPPSREGSAQTAKTGIPEFTTDDIALAIEIRGVYDGIAVYLLKTGELVNRFRRKPGWSARQIAATDEWISKNGDRIRAQNADLLDATATTHEGNP